MKKWLCLLGLFVLTELSAQCPPMLAGGHAHNDYAKLFRPKLHRALDLGFASIEVDVYPLGSSLKVAHYPLFLGLKRDFEELYLQPAIARFEERGCLFEGHSDLTLMIDIKRNPAEAYQQLLALCRKYESYIQHYDTVQGVWTYGPIRLLLSGKVPREAVFNDAEHWMQIDGRLSDLPLSEAQLPYFGRISQRWPFGKELEEAEKEQLRVWLEQTGDLPLRFWALPQSPQLWDTLKELGFKLYHVDKLRRYSKWRQEQ